MAGMDVDAALNELGMLSSVTDSRKQYVCERTRRRVRQVSEPGNSGLSVETSMSEACMTPSNSPNKGMYQIVTLNPQFVTSLSAGMAALDAAVIQDASPQHIDQLGSRYCQESLDFEAKTSRLSRLKCSRIRRYRKPYEVPWLQRHSIDVCYSSVDAASPENSNDSTASCSTPPIDSSLNLGPFSTPEKTRPTESMCKSSDTTTPEKSAVTTPAPVTRSKSLDDLDFSKLKLAEAENQNFIVQKKEIDSMSQYLQNLNVNE